MTTDEQPSLYSVRLAGGRSAAPGLWRCRRFTLQELLDLHAAGVPCLVVLGHEAELRSLTLRHPNLAGLVEAMRSNDDPAAGPMLRLAGEIGGPRPAGASFVYLSRSTSTGCIPAAWRIHELAILSPSATARPPAAAMVEVQPGPVFVPGAEVLDVDCTRKPAPDLPKPAAATGSGAVVENKQNPRRRRVAASRSRRS